MDLDTTATAAAIVFTILIPAVGYLYVSKADSGNTTRDLENLRDLIKQHSESDERLFKELRDGQQRLGEQITHTLETVVLEIRKVGYGIDRQ